MKTQTKSNIRLGEESIEAKRSSVMSDFKDIGDSTMKSFWEDLLTGVAKGAREQISGSQTQPKTSGELTEGEEVVIKKTQALEVLQKTQHREYFRKIEKQETMRVENKQEIEAQVQRLRLEIKQLINASRELQVSFKEVAKDDVLVNPGKYHLNFFEWVLAVVKNARLRIEESTNWLRLFASKKKQKQYWNQSKKHGTSFSLSNERVVATQAG